MTRGMPCMESILSDNKQDNHATFCRTPHQTRLCNPSPKTAVTAIFSKG
jgi:hypothetical protein